MSRVHEQVARQVIEFVRAGGDRFNPFDWIDPKRPDFIEVCRDLANMLVVRTGKEHGPALVRLRGKRHRCVYRLYLCAGRQPGRTQPAGRAGTDRLAGQTTPRRLEVMQQT